MYGYSTTFGTGSQEIQPKNSHQGSFSVRCRLVVHKGDYVINLPKVSLWNFS
nr:MAG TPA: hypothetical protein [Caudoviricetes sp.]